MPAGLQALLTGRDVNGTGGGLARELNQLFSRIEDFQSQFLASTDLTLPPWDFTADDEAALKAAFNDLVLLASIYRGTATREEGLPYDFRTFTKRIFGFGS